MWPPWHKRCASISNVSSVTFCHLECKAFFGVWGEGFLYVKSGVGCHSDHGFQHFKSRNETTDDCGDFYLEDQLDGYLPAECSPVVYVGAEKSQVLDGSGHGSSFDEREDARYWPMTTALSKVPTRSLLAQSPVTSSFPLDQRSTPPAGMVRASGGTRLPVLHAPSPEAQWRGFQAVLGEHVNRFNQRLSMLEGNMLEMKETLRDLKNQQSLFSLKLTGAASRTDKSTRIEELAKTYMDLEGRLCRLDSRQEILIDGFTALARELRKIKRIRHVARAPQASGSSEAAVAMVEVTTTKAATRATVSARAQKIAVPKSIVSSHTTHTTRDTTPTSQQNGQQKIIVSSTKGLPKPTVRKIQHSDKRMTSNDAKINLTLKGNRQQKITRATYPKTTPSPPLSTTCIPFHERRKSPLTNIKTPTQKLTSQQNQRNVKERPSGKRTGAPSCQESAQKQNCPGRKTISGIKKPQFQLEPPSYMKPGPTKPHAPNQARATTRTKPKKAARLRQTVKPNESSRNYVKLAPTRTANTRWVVGKPYTVQMNRKTKYNNRPNKKYRLDRQSREGALYHDGTPKRDINVRCASDNPAPPRKSERSNQNVNPDNSKRQSKESNAQSQFSIWDALGLKGQGGQNTRNGNKQIQNGELLISLGKLAIPVKIIPDF